MRSKLLRSVIARYGRLARGMTLGVRVLAQDEEGRISLVRHGYAPGWHLPGGAVEVGEAAVEAAIRELPEEVGAMTLEPPKLFGLYFNPGFGGRDHVALFTASRFEIGEASAPSREIAERGWFPYDALPDDTTPATRRRLAEVVESKPVSPRW